MVAKTLRQERINELIRKNIGDILVKEVALKAGVLATVTKVDVQPDLRQARIGLSVFPEGEEEYALETLRKEIYRIQGILNEKIATNPLPRIRFFLDKTASQANQVEVLLMQIEREL